MDVANVNPIWIPIVFLIAASLMVVAIVGMVYWFKARDRELRYHQELRVKEMEHQTRMKQLEIELEKTKAEGSSRQAA